MRSQAQSKRSVLIRRCNTTFEEYMNQRLKGKTHKQIIKDENNR